MIFGLENNVPLTLSGPAILAFSSHLALGHNWVIQLSFTWDFSSPESTQMLELPGFLGESENYRLMKQGNAFLLLCFSSLPLTPPPPGSRPVAVSVHWGLGLGHQDVGLRITSPPSFFHFSSRCGLISKLSLSGILNVYDFHFPLRKEETPALLSVWIMDNDSLSWRIRQPWSLCISVEDKLLGRWCYASPDISPLSLTF